MKLYKDFFKRFLDVLFSIGAIIVFLPIFFIVAFFVKKNMGKPIVFAQKRIGKDEKVFNIYKFRSMTDEKDDNGNLLDDEKRLTKLGLFLRNYSLDELPELFTILKGDMSFVGPRPLPVDYIPYFLDKERKRHKVVGGLIPPDSLCGELMPSWETQFEYDCYYADNISLWLDLKVILVTFKVLILRVYNSYGSQERPRLDLYRKNIKRR